MDDAWPAAAGEQDVPRRPRRKSTGKRLRFALFRAARRERDAVVAELAETLRDLWRGTSGPDRAPSEFAMRRFPPRDEPEVVEGAILDVAFTVGTGHLPICNNDETNLVTARFACNRSKRAKTLDEWVRRHARDEGA